MTERIRLDDLTSDQLDQLYERVAIYRAAWHSARGRAVHQRCINADLRTELAAKSNRADRAEAAIARVRALHQPVEGIGYGCDGDDTPGSYGRIAQACSACGTPEEYAVRWPCPTIRALDEPASGPAATQATDGTTCCGKPGGAVCVHDLTPKEQR